MPVELDAIILITPVTIGPAPFAILVLLYVVLVASVVRWGDAATEGAQRSPLYLIVPGLVAARFVGLLAGPMSAMTLSVYFVEPHLYGSHYTYMGKLLVGGVTQAVVQTGAGWMLLRGLTLWTSRRALQVAVVAALLGNDMIHADLFMRWRQEGPYTPPEVIRERLCGRSGFGPHGSFRYLDTTGLHGRSMELDEVMEYWEGDRGSYLPPDLEREREVVGWCPFVYTFGPGGTTASCRDHPETRLRIPTRRRASPW